MKAYSPDQLIERMREADDEDLRRIIKEVFTDKFYHNYENELIFLIKRASYEVLSDVIEVAFTRAHSSEWTNAFKHLVNRITTEDEMRMLRKHIIVFIFSKEHSTVYCVDRFKTFVDLKDPELDKLIIQKVFTKPHSVRWRKSLKSMIERANPELMDIIFREVFNKDTENLWKEENNYAHDFLY